MDLMPSISYLLLLLVVIISTLSRVSAIPARPRSGLLDSLKTGYYYIDDGVITAISPDTLITIARDSSRPPPGKRRQDTDVSADGQSANSVKFKPVVRYKQTKTKRKKLFVPNFFG
ncbi:uncharacterized protein LOC101897557 [Musca domestica]|uniref:Uncharacterized protein LOC101897557 n=1 Tax=Musca domestica TaxID=7370 RepID=A0A1I8MI10_MUSDO|nr:uncharacterized protein LOC101897557 [Musca domestica]